MFLLVPMVVIALFVGNKNTQADNVLRVSPPIIMQGELVKRQEVVLPPPTPVTF